MAVETAVHDSGIASGELAARVTGENFAADEPLTDGGGQPRLWPYRTLED